MKKIVMIAIAVLSLAPYVQCAEGPGSGMDEAAVFQRANDRFNDGDYASAVDALDSILKTGIKSGNLYYNLGNCYFKMKKLGKSILNYERAKLLIPRDSDLLSNYKLAKAQLKQKDPASKKHWILASLDAAFGYLTYPEIFLLAGLLYISGMLLVIVCLFFNDTRRFVVPVIVISLFLLATFIPPLHQRSIDMDRAGIVTAAITDARFEPLKRAEVNFPLYEGMKVYILHDKSGWRKIMRLDGKIGWVDRESVEPIVNY